MRILILLLAAMAAGAQTAEKMLEAARHKEVMTGDLKGAIAEYRKIAAKFAGQPEVAAQALWKMGQCQEKLGESEARKSYERVVKEYAGAGNYVAQAKARLAAMGGGGPAEPRTRLVWNAATDAWGRVTADGRYLSHVDWTTGDLALRDLRAGESRRVTNYGGYSKAEGEAESTSISPDGKRIVFNWQRWDKASKQEGLYQLRVINIDGSGERILRKSEPGLYFEAYGWSADGKWVAVCEERKGAGGDESPRIALLAPDTGEMRVVATDSQQWKSDILVSPDGKWLAYMASPVRNAQTMNVYLIAAEGAGQKETMVAEAAELMGWTPRGDGLVIRSGERMRLLPVAEGRAAGETKELHVPGMDRPHSLGITPDGALFYSTMNRRMEAGVSRVDTVNGLSLETAMKIPVSGIGFANNQGNLRFSPDGKQLASSNSNQSIRIRNVAGTGERILTVPVKELRRFEWMPDGGSLLASALGADGKFGLYRIDAMNGAATFVCGIDPGLVFTPSAEGASVFHFTTRGLRSIELATGNERELLARNFGSQGPLNMRRSRDGKFLLLTTFAFIGIYDIASGELREVFRRVGEVGDSVWVADWSADGRHVFALARAAMNDRQREFRIYPVAGGEPRRQTLTGTYRDFATSPDGIHAAITKAESHGQVWTLEDFLPGRK